MSISFENFVTWDNHQLYDKSAVEIGEACKKRRHDEHSVSIS